MPDRGAGEWFAAERHDCGCEVTILRSETSSTVTDYECPTHRRERIARTAEEAATKVDFALYGRCRR